MDRPMACLAFRDGRIHEIASDVTTLGRARDNDVLLAVPVVSSHHARVIWNGDGFVLEDVGSSNGTRLDGVSVPAAGAALRNGAEVLLATVPLSFYITEDTPTVRIEPSAAPELRVDRSRDEVTLRGEAVTLTRQELRFLLCLSERPGALVRRDEIAQAVWPGELGDTSEARIDKLVQRLRAKIDRDRFLRTVKGLGYRLEL